MGAAWDLIQWRGASPHLFRPRTPRKKCRTGPGADPGQTKHFRAIIAGIHDVLDAGHCAKEEKNKQQAAEGEEYGINFSSEGVSKSVFHRCSRGITREEWIWFENIFKGKAVMGQKL